MNTDLLYDERRAIEAAARAILAHDSGGVELAPLRDVIAKVDARRFDEGTADLTTSMAGLAKRHFLTVVEAATEAAIVAPVPKRERHYEGARWVTTGGCQGGRWNCSRAGTRPAPKVNPDGALVFVPSCGQHRQMAIEDAASNLYLRAIQGADLSSYNPAKSSLSDWVAFVKGLGVEIDSGYADGLKARGIEVA